MEYNAHVILSPASVNRPHLLNAVNMSVSDKYSFETIKLLKYEFWCSKLEKLQELATFRINAPNFDEMFIAKLELTYLH